MPPSGDDSTEKREQVLGPDELDIEAHENVVPIEEGRYVITADEASAERAAAAAERLAREMDEADESATGRAAEREETEFEFPTSDGDASSPGPELDARAVREWHERALRAEGANYAFRISSNSEGDVAHGQFSSDDVGTAFGALVRWYAGRLDQELPPADVLGILLTESDLRVRYPPGVLRELAAAHGLGRDDSIADLLRAVSDDGVLLPPDEGEAPSGRDG